MAGAHVKLPPVQPTLDYMSTHTAFRQRRTAMRTRIFDGIEFATYVVNSDIVTIRKHESGARAWRNIGDCADNEFSVRGERRWYAVRFSIE